MATPSKETKPHKLNHLAGEKSPYLIQHARNPVDWYPWGEKAFAKARKENKPIFLSIGYSTCHWCHVMERESFTNKEIADFLNQHFVSIKVDREERPDVDKIYMTAYQVMYQSGGGWPLNMFLTPDLKPFAGGTYFPPEDRQGRPGFLRVIKTLSTAWDKQGAEVIKSANDLHERMRQIVEAKIESSQELTLNQIDTACKKIQESMDPEQGGWGINGPKFPQVSHLRLLLRYWQRTGDKLALKNVLLTCDKMLEGGIHDQLMGGFHRYSVDRNWLVPHFEKMLYDQAQLLDLYLDVWLITGDLRYRDVAISIADYVIRDLQYHESDEKKSGGGFFAAQDAQSEGKEGKCFCWTYSELSQWLTPEEMSLVTRWFGITKKGNFIDNSDPEPLQNQNILHLAEPQWKLTEKERVTLDSAIQKMRAVRSKRVPAETDHKIMADWNGMMIASLARAGRVLHREHYIVVAKQAHQFIKEKLWDGKQLYHSWCDGERTNSQQASSYLEMIAGSIALYETTLDPDYLDFAIQLADGGKSLFYDTESGGFFLGTKRPDLVLRIKDDYDGAIPTVSSVGAMQFYQLAVITGREDFHKVVEKTLSGMTGVLQQSPQSMAWMLCVADNELGASARVVIAGEKGDDAMLNACYGVYLPRLTVMGTRGKVEPFSQQLKPIDNKATAYFCLGKACHPPVTDPETLKRLIKKEMKVSSKK